jgi:hypothetical protein
MQSNAMLQAVQCASLLVMLTMQFPPQYHYMPRSTSSMHIPTWLKSVTHW